MGEKIIVGPVNRGLRTDRTPFVIDNDSFPTLQNAYQWRGRVKRKRGTSFLGRLQRYFNSLNKSLNTTTNTDIVFDGSGNSNILTPFSLQTNSSIVQGSVTITMVVSGNVYTDNGTGGLLLGGVTLSGTINYATGAILIITEAGNAATVAFIYYPTLPVMGLEDLTINSTQYPGTIAFDTTYSYNIPTTYSNVPSTPYIPYDVSFYKNPPASALYPGYVPKSLPAPTSWNGKDYQQFWTTNYEGALWATNGVDVPPTLSTIGMQFTPSITPFGASTVTFVSQMATTITVTITNCPLIIGDFVFLNEWTSGTPANAVTLNYQSGYVTACAPNTTPYATKTLTITLPYAAIATDTYTPGIIQYLTNRSNPAVDCLRWYDGSPTNSIIPPTFLSSGNGWVNFAPPLNNLILFPNFTIAELLPAQYYLVGARMILPFKDRLMFFGPVIQTSNANSQVYIQDAIIFSQNGTPYYTCSFTGDPSLATTVFRPILTPLNQTTTGLATIPVVSGATATAYWEDLTGYGGYIQAGVAKPILSVAPNEDVLVVGFSTLQTKVVYTGNDLLPFQFYLTNSELGSGSTFSTIVMDQGVMTRGNRGFVISNQTGTQRIDLDILDNVFEINLQNNGAERFTAQRDFINEWVYFTYLSNQSAYIYPNQTLFYNYRDNSWAVFNESYTTYGQFRPVSGLTWDNAPIWNTWTDAWDSGSNTLFQPQVIGGNQQGFVVFRENEQVEEESSLVIQNIVGNTITSPNHGLNLTDFIIVTGAIGTVSTLVNGVVFQVVGVTTNTIIVSAPPTITGTYTGGGLITRMYIPLIQTKQFPVSWAMARKTRLGPQQYLLTTTDDSQITLQIYLSQNATDPYNAGPIVPSIGSVNNSLVYSAVLYTCPESSNLGLTPANTNIQMVTAAQQEQTWHRMNTSLLGDTIQIGFTLSNDQMFFVDDEGNTVNQFAEIEIHGFILDVTPSMVLA